MLWWNFALAVIVKPKEIIWFPYRHWGLGLVRNTHACSSDEFDLPTTSGFGYVQTFPFHGLVK